MPKLMQYKQSNIPYFEGDNDERIFILQKGSVVLSALDVETRQNVTSSVKPGEFFGVKSALGHFPREETASAVSDITVVVLTVAEFEKLFCESKALIIKMLKVFSGQLRAVHKKISTILKTPQEDQTTAMMQVAKSFYDDQQYKACCNVCEKILLRFPDNPIAQKASKLNENSKLCLQSERPKIVSAEDREKEKVESIPKNSFFSLPAFERFSKTYEEGSVIISEFEPGDTFYLIQSGQVQLIKSAGGIKKNLDILNAGEFFGEMAILDDSPRSATCMAKTQVKVLEFSKENFLTLMTGNPHLALNLLKLFAKRINDQKKRLGILVIKDMTIRIFEVFMMLSEMYKDTECEKKGACKLNVTIADIANWAALPESTVQDEIAKLRSKKKIEMTDKYIIINNVKEMKHEIDSYSQLSSTGRATHS